MADGAAQRGSTREIEALARDVERVLCDLVAQFERLGALAAERREAMGRADTARLARCIAEESEAVQRVAEIEKRRIAAVGRLAERIGGTERSQTKVSWLAERLGGAAGERLRQRCEELRERACVVRRANEIARQAASSLAAHMEGLWRQATRTVQRSQTYGRMGAMATGAAVVSAVDVRS